MWNYQGAPQIWDEETRGGQCLLATGQHAATSSPVDISAQAGPLVLETGQGPGDTHSSWHVL